MRAWPINCLPAIALAGERHAFAWVGFGLLGLSDGLFWSSLPVVSNRVFGLKHSGGIYGMMVMFGASGFIALGFGVQPAVYRSQVRSVTRSSVI